MLICEEHKFVFLRNPKTASRSVAQALKENFNTFEIEPYHGQNIPEKYLKYYVFFAVRNPYTRMVSAWQHICVERNWSPEEFTFDKSFKINSVITRHIDWACGADEKTVDSWWSQSYVADKFKANIISYENIDNDFNNLPFINDKIILPRIGKQNYEDWKKYYTVEIEKEIYRCFKKDLDRFEYKRFNIRKLYL